MGWWLLCGGFCAVAVGGDVNVQSLVVLRGQRAFLDPEAKPRPVFRFVAEAHNQAPLPVAAVEIGILCAVDDASLSVADPARLFVGQEAPRITVMRQWLPAEVPSGGAGRVELRMPLNASERPAAFSVHLLAYEVAAVDAGGLLTLLRQQTAPDERSAVLALGLGRDAKKKRAARRRWRSNQALVADLAAHLAEPIPERPDHVATLTRVYAALALGVLGGEAAERALGTFARQPEIHAFDEPLQVLRASRLTATELDAAVAFGLPPGARGMTEVLEAAQNDLAGWPVQALADKLEATLDPKPAPKQSRSLAPLVGAGVGIAVFALLWGGLWWLSRARIRKAR